MVGENSALLVGAAALSFASASLIGSCASSAYARKRLREKSRRAVFGSGSTRLPGAIGSVVRCMESCSRNAMAKRRSVPPKAARGRRDYAIDIRRAGLADSVSVQGFALARMRLAGLGASAGLLLGFVFSLELAFVLACAGLCLGWASPRWAVRTCAKERKGELEKHLPEMLDVLSLGLRSGLSFDRSLDAYIEHFDTLLSRSLASAKRQWTLGFSSRDEALRSLADAYDSMLFSRCVEAIARSLRFGSSLAESLESIAGEARGAYRAVRQERVAKAPVKMMIPTGALMLPAMLLLVLGPVLLELVEGF